MKKGFTLIELLIVVAIIAILAAIAVPNFLEAQTRAKVTRCKADMRSVAVALEAYAVDWNRYPFDGYNYDSSRPDSAGWGANAFNYWYLPKTMTTPQAYITNIVFPDPFRQQIPPVPGAWQINNLRYVSMDSTWGTAFDQIETAASVGVSTYYGLVNQEWGKWYMDGAGPDRTYGPTGWVGVSTYPPSSLPLPYDPTNGTVSDGDIMRSQRSSNSGYVNAS